jgi:hypothetical protein
MPDHARPAFSQDNAMCSEAISSVSSSLVGQYGVVLRSVTKSTTDHPRNPFPGSETLFMPLLVNYNIELRTEYERIHTQKADNFLNSPKTMEALATQIIKLCPNISVVNFYRANSGDSNPIFRMPLGSPKIGIWLDACGKNIGEYKWGYYVAC